MNGMTSNDLTMSNKYLGALLSGKMTSYFVHQTNMADVVNMRILII